MAKKWEFYRSDRDADVVRKEIAKCKLNQSERVRLGKVMERAADGTLFPKDWKNLKEGLYELRLNGEGRTYRLFYGDIDGGLVLLAVKFTVKKSTQGIATRPEDIEAARKRLSEWQSRHISDQLGG